MSKSKLSKEISQNLVLTRRIEDFLISKNYLISEYDNRKINLKILCGDAVSETIGDMLYEDDGTIKYMITNYKGEVMTILVGYLEDDCIEDIYRCKDSRMKDMNGGEILLCYVLLKYNTIDKNIKSIKGGVAGAIPPIKKSDSASVIKQKKDRLIKYHVDRNAILENVNGNIMFTYTLSNVITNIKKILRNKNALTPSK